MYNYRVLFALNAFHIPYSYGKKNRCCHFFVYLCMVNFRTPSKDQMKWRQIIGYFINHKWERTLKEVVLPNLNFYLGIWWSHWCGYRENSVTIADVRSGIWNLYLLNTKPECQTLEPQFNSTHSSCYCVWINWLAFNAAGKLKINLPTMQGLFESLSLSQFKYVRVIKRSLTTYHSQQSTSPANLNSLTILTKGILTAFRSATRLIQLSTSVISAVRVTDVNKMLPRKTEGFPFQTYIFITCLVFFCRYFVNHSRPTTQCMTSQTSKYQYHFFSSNQS